MAYRRNASNSAIYLIALIVIIVAFFMLGGWPWLQGLIHSSNSLGISNRHEFHGAFQSRSFGTANWNWPQILISFGLGFLLGILVSRRR